MRQGWIAFVARRWFSARRESGSSASSFLAAAGIAIGVAALIIVLGVMNGFQMGFIDSILEITSFHVRVELDRSGGPDESLASRLATDPAVRSVLPFTETRCLVEASNGRAQAITLRALPEDAARRDPGLMAALGLSGPLFPADGGLVIGAELARSLNVTPGQSIELVVVAASRSEGVEARSAPMIVSRTFRSGYYEYDSGLVLVALDRAPSIFPPGRSLDYTYGIKLKNRAADASFVARLSSYYRLPPERVESWRDYNRAFFGALRTEKTMMMLLIGLIFLVVGVNIYHAMRRSVAERMEDIALLQAVGSDARAIRRTFMFDGLAIGAGGAVIGLLLGLLVAVNVNEVFALVETIVDTASTLVSQLLGARGGADFRVFSPQYFYLMEVPVRILFPETLFIVAAAIASAVLSAGVASSAISRLEPAVVLRYE